MILSSDTKLEVIRKNIDSAYLYFQRNYQRFDFFKRMIYETTLTDNQKAFLAALNRPIAEFNLYNAYIARLVGEFTKIDPTLNVKQEPAIKEEVDLVKMKLAQAHIHYIIHEFNQNSGGKETYKDSLGGGFGVVRIRTDYSHPMSMQQCIKMEKCDPCMVGFDPMARLPHKGDGRYSFELFPLAIEDAKIRYPNADFDSLKGMSSQGPFRWSVNGVDGSQSVIICEFFEKRKKHVQIVQLSDGRIMPKSQYKKILESWNAFAVPPEQVGEPRWTTQETIWRYEICGNTILKSTPTDWCYLPHVFFDGDSTMLREETSGSVYQFTRPAIYNARGIQDLKNSSGIALLNHLENMLQSKWVVKKESIPEEQDYIDAITNIQSVNTVVVNAYSENNPNQPIPEPIREVVQQPAPPEVMGAFNSAEQTFQAIQGGFSSNLGKDSSNLSGKAIIEAASQDNAAALPFIDGYLKGLEWCGVVMLDLLPKYILGERSIPVRLPNGETKTVIINPKNTKTFDFSPYSLNLTIEPGFSFQVQQDKTAQQIIGFSQAMPGFGQFMNSTFGMPILLQNMTMKNANELQEAFKMYSKQQEEAQKKAAQQPNPEMLIGQAEMLKAQADMIRAQADAKRKAAESEVAAAKVMVDQQRVDNESIETTIKATQEEIKDAMSREKDKADLVGKNIENVQKLLEIGRGNQNDQGI